jgi:hypothetical protein
LSYQNDDWLRQELARLRTQDAQAQQQAEAAEAARRHQLTQELERLEAARAALKKLHRLLYTQGNPDAHEFEVYRPRHWALAALFGEGNVLDKRHGWRIASAERITLRMATDGSLWQERRPSFGSIADEAASWGGITTTPSDPFNIPGPDNEHTHDGLWRMFLHHDLPRLITQHKLSW